MNKRQYKKAVKQLKAEWPLLRLWPIAGRPERLHIVERVEAIVPRVIPVYVATLGYNNQGGYKLERSYHQLQQVTPASGRQVVDFPTLRSQKVRLDIVNRGFSLGTNIYRKGNNGLQKTRQVEFQAEDIVEDTA
jgi:hypothetical protein